MKRPAIQKPEGITEVLLHACCAPCSSAIVEWLMANGVRPTIFYFNPNIYPREEYEIRKNESKRHAESLGLRWIDGDYNHERWLHEVKGMEHEPECGRRCQQCFNYRLYVAALQAKELGLEWFTTTLASSRWKRIEQINAAGMAAEKNVRARERESVGARERESVRARERESVGARIDLPIEESKQETPPSVPDLVPSLSRSLAPSPHYWAQNWRKGGLYERRNQLLKDYAFYNQQYCGCEFSMRNTQRSSRDDG